MSVIKVLIETEEFLEWMKSKYLPTLENAIRFLTEQIIENCKDSRKDVAEFRVGNAMRFRKLLQTIEEAKILVQIAKKEEGKDSISKVYKKTSAITALINLDSKELDSFKKTLEKKYFNMNRLFLESRTMIKKPSQDYYVKLMSVARGLTSALHQRSGFFKKLKALGLFHHFLFKNRQILKINGKKVTITVHSPPISRKIKIALREFSYKDFLLESVRNNISSLKDEERKELYSVYSEEIKDKTNNEILNELVDYVHELCKIVLETNQQYILSDNFEISIRILDLTEHNAAAICNSDLCTSDSAYISINTVYLLRLASANYDFFQKKYHLTNPDFGDAMLVLAHELAHAKDFYELNLRDKQILELQNKIGINHILPETINLFRFLSLIRTEAISQIHEVFVRRSKETTSIRPEYFNYLYVPSSDLYTGTFNKLIEEAKKSIEMLKEVKLDEKDFRKVTEIKYPLGKYCAFTIFLYFYFNSKQEKILTFGKDFKEINEKLKNYLLSKSGKDNKKFLQLRNEIILNPEKVKSFFAEKKIYLLRKSEIGKCIENDIQFHLYLPDFNFANQFLTALKNMNIVRFFEYYEKACRYFDIPKEKTIFAIKELKETQQFAERLHKEEVQKAGFKH